MPERGILRFLQILMVKISKITLFLLKMTVKNKIFLAQPN